MRTIDLLQCESCKKNLEDFICLHDMISKEEIELLEHYAVFCEMKRLKEKSLEKKKDIKVVPIPDIPLQRPFEDIIKPWRDPKDWVKPYNPFDPMEPYKITC